MLVCQLVRAVIENWKIGLFSRLTTWNNICLVGASAQVFRVRENVIRSLMFFLTRRQISFLWVIETSFEVKMGRSLFFGSFVKNLIRRNISYFQHELRICPIKKFSNLRKIIWKLRIIFKDFSSKMTKIRSQWFKCFATLLWLHSEVGICLWAVDNWININSSFDLHPIDNSINSISIGSEKVGKCSLCENQMQMEMMDHLNTRGQSS